MLGTRKGVVPEPLDKGGGFPGLTLLCTEPCKRQGSGGSRVYLLSSGFPSPLGHHRTLSRVPCLLLLPPIPPSIRVFSNESTLPMGWPKYWSFSFSIIPSKEIPGVISFRMDWLGLLAVQGTLKSLLQHHSSKPSILRCSGGLRPLVELCVEPAGLCGRCTGVAVPLRVVPSPTGLQNALPTYTRTRTHS